ncbi:MAG: AAA family ATPase [Candidatus Gracilibacteria bacterium]|nr:AAA family ATPase [Candidatus Gracilibacteria bacterium]
MQKMIIALAGEMGCGKGTVVKHLVSHHDAVMYKFSDSLRDILDRIHRDKSRDNIQKISTALRSAFGDDILSEIILGDIGASDASLIIVDGVRRDSDIKYLKNLPGFRLVYIDAELTVRYARVIARGENSNDTTKTLEEFLRESEAETETRIRGLRDIAQVVIENNGTLEAFEEQCENLLK